MIAIAAPISCGGIAPMIAPWMPITEQVDALRLSAPPWFAVAIDLGFGAGLRQSEATGLTVDRID